MDQAELSMEEDDDGQEDDGDGRQSLEQTWRPHLASHACAKVGEDVVHGPAVRQAFLLCGAKLLCAARLMS